MVESRDRGRSFSLVVETGCATPFKVIWGARGGDDAFDAKLVMSASGTFGLVEMTPSLASLSCWRAPFSEESVFRFLEIGQGVSILS